MVALENDETLRFTGDKWVYARRDYPAQDVSLRDAEGERFAVLDAADNFRMIEEMSATTAPQRVHPGAIYLHQGESYLVTEYNADLRHAIVTPVAADYYTQPRELNDVRIVRSLRHRELPTTTAYLGRVRVSSQVIGYRRLQQFSEAVLEDVPLEMPRDRVRDGRAVVGPARGSARASWPAAGWTSWAASTRPSTRPSASCRSSPCATAGTSAG